MKKTEEYRLFVKYRKNGDLEAKEKLIMAYYSLVLWTVRNFSKKQQKQDFEDCIQDCFVKTIELLDTFDYHRGSKFSTYLVNCLKNYIRSSERKIEFINYYTTDCELESLKDELYYYDNYDELEHIELINNIKTIIDDDEYQLISILFGLDGKKCTSKEIANSLGVSESFLSKRKKNILEKINSLVYCNLN